MIIITENWHLILFLIGVGIYLRYMHQFVMRIMSKPATLLWTTIQIIFLATIKFISLLLSLNTIKTIRNHYLFIWLAFIATYLNVILLPEISSENQPTIITLNCQFVFMISCLSRARPDWAYEFPDRTGPDTQICRTGPAGPD